MLRRAREQALIALANPQPTELLRPATSHRVCARTARDVPPAICRQARAQPAFERLDVC